MIVKTFVHHDCHVWNSGSLCHLFQVVQGGLVLIRTPIQISIPQVDGHWTKFRLSNVRQTRRVLEKIQSAVLEQKVIRQLQSQTSELVLVYVL